MYIEHSSKSSSADVDVFGSAKSHMQQVIYAGEGGKVRQHEALQHKESCVIYGRLCETAEELKNVRRVIVETVKETSSYSNSYLFAQMRDNETLKQTRRRLANDEALQLSQCLQRTTIEEGATYIEEDGTPRTHGGTNGNDGHHKSRRVSAVVLKLRAFFKSH